MLTRENNADQSPNDSVFLCKAREQDVQWFNDLRIAGSSAIISNQIGIKTEQYHGAKQNAHENLTNAKYMTAQSYKHIPWVCRFRLASKNYIALIDANEKAEVCDKRR